jgi:hypothetical protein
MKMPNLASWYQVGTSNRARESQSGVKGPRPATFRTSATVFAIPGSGSGAEAPEARVVRSRANTCVMDTSGGF